jgi:hypothetical protein
LELEMGGCLSGDVQGGMEAVGGGGRSRCPASAAAQAGGPNDAVDHFFQAQGHRGLYTPLEVPSSKPYLVAGARRLLAAS